jgi:hypothetical protein
MARGTSRAIGRAVSAALIVAAAAPVQSAPAGEASAQAWARCIWERVPTTASNFVKLPPLKPRHSYGEDSTGYRLILRLKAACYETMMQPGAPAPPAVEHRDLQRALLAAKPGEIGPDRQEPYAFRCERFFADDPAMARSAGVDWGFGADMKGHEFLLSRTVFNSQLTSADVAGLLSDSGKGMQAVKRLLDVEPAKVATYAEAAGSGEPFVLDDDAGLRRCRMIGADGSLVDPQAGAPQ